MRSTAILRSPPVHFLLLGALLFLVRDHVGLGSVGIAPASSQRIRFDAARIAELRDDFSSQLGRAPTRPELDRLVSQAVDEEILYREALARGLQEGDDGVEARLVQKMLFLEAGASSVDPTDPAVLAGIAKRARSLGLDQDDVVIRRILVQKIRLMATVLAPEELPTEAELARDYAERREVLREPERRRLVHVFVSRDRRGPRTQTDAETFRRRITEEKLAPTAAIALGDAFPFGHAFAGVSVAELERSFGVDFAARVVTLPLAAWSEPIDSAYGLHLVRIEEIVSGAIPPFAAVRERLRLEREEEPRDRKLEALLATLRTRYEVAVSWPDESHGEEGE